MENPDSFAQFLTMLFKRGRIRQSLIDKLLEPRWFKEFTDAFTHTSFGAESNYEVYEFLGDGVINEFLPFYVKWRFPDIVNVKWYTRIRHNLSSKKQLAVIANRQGLDKYIRYGEEIKLIMEENPDLNTNIKYLSMLEDVVEAFFGCLTHVITSMGFKHGVATQISHNILHSFFDAEEISTRYEDIFDAVTRLKELYERKDGVKWPNNKAYSVEEIEGGYEATVYGWTRGDKTPIPANRVVLAIARGKNEKDAKQNAAAQALRVLEKNYGMVEAPPDKNVKK